MSKVILVLAFALFLIGLGPLATIWSLNLLFPALAIPVDFSHWLAVAVLLAISKTTIKKD